MYEYKAVIDRVVDGDTYECMVDLGFRTYIDKVQLRLRGIDTPETWRPKSEAEAAHGAEATRFVEALVAIHPVSRIVTYKHGPSSFARYEADVYLLDSDGSEFSLADALREENYEKLKEYD